MPNTDIKKILVVDDNEILVHSIERHLRREGYEVVVSYDGRMAKDLVLAAELAGAPFDLAISDILMPNMDGFTFVTWLNREFSRIAVLIISGFGSLDQINKILRPALDCFHRKPVLPQQILRSIEKINRYRQGLAMAEGA